MDDGARLPYVLYLPARAGRVPVLFIYNPYEGGSADITAPGPLAEEMRDYLSHGYAVLAASVRGSGCSAGLLEFQSPHIARDGEAFVEWAAAQSWSDGNVGMFGLSYSGMTQFMVGGRRPPHLKAIAAGAPPATIYHDVHYPGGIFNYGFAAQWTFVSQASTTRRGADFRRAAGDSECEGLLARQRPNRMFYELRDHPLHDAWWSTRSIEPDAARLAVPALIMHSWQDQQIAPIGGVRLFQRVTGPRRLVLANGGHTFLYRTRLMQAERVRWFDRWLKGHQNGIDTEPAVTVLFEASRVGAGTGLADLAVGWSWSFTGWPIPGTEWTTFMLTTDGRLTGELLTAEPGTRTYVYPLGTELVGDNASFAVAPSPPGSLRYRSAPHAKDLAILGAPVLTLHMSAETGETDLMAVLHDVGPDGKVTYLQRGFLRASHRRLDPVLSRPLEPRHLHASVERLLPGRVYELTFSLFPLGHVVRAGHVLELLVLAPSGIPSPNWGLALAMAPGVNTIHHSSTHPSRLVVPTLPGRTAGASRPACGALDYQPCR
jgi:putative CocE/NonD family hydrolase